MKTEFELGTGILEVKLKKKIKQQSIDTIHIHSSLNHNKLNTFETIQLNNDLDKHINKNKRRYCDTNKNNIKNKDITNHNNNNNNHILPIVSNIHKKNHTNTNHIKSIFSFAYERGELPVLIEHKTGDYSLKWTIDINQLDYIYFLPLFVEGLKEIKDPCHFLSKQGSNELLDHGIIFPAKVHSCLNKIIPSIRNALNTKNLNIICDTLKFIKKLLIVEGIGKAILPYYRQLLPILNIYKNKRINIGDAIDYGQRKDNDLSSLIQETLEFMERKGGPNAYINIKYMIPTYEGIKN